MTMILLIVSVGCNLQLLFLLLYDRIIGTKIARFFKSIVKVWRLLEETEKGRQMAHVKLPASDSGAMDKSRFKMASTQTSATILVQEVAIPEKGIKLSEGEATLDDEGRKAVSRPVQVPDNRLEETFMSIPPEEMGYRKNGSEGDTPDTPRAPGSSFDEIDDAVRTARNPEATHREREKAARVFADMKGTELYDRMMGGSPEIAVRIKGFIEVRMKKPKKEFIVPNNIEDLGIRNYI